MCGITGFLDKTSCKKNSQLTEIIVGMSDTLRHRGPDDQGAWVDENCGIALGHRRLSIIDVSVAGHQPMQSQSGRYVIILNGEIYNFKALRKELELEGFKFRGHSDTEVMLAQISRDGIEGALEKFNGMFAFALWDRQDKMLYLCRDRLGEKPLYYGFINNAFVFGSELKALKKFPGFIVEIDRQALTLYLRYNCIPAPYSIYKNIKKLLPGEILTFKIEDGSFETKVYWSVSDVACDFIGDNWNKNPQETAQEAEALLKDAVKIRMESDVPLGVFLSGGIDSSLIAALMQAQSNVPINTFTIGFGDKRYNEEEDARIIAKHLGTAHTSLYATAEDALNIIPGLPQIYDEPFADSSQIPTILVSKIARKFVTVCLSGDSGDEIFGGYNRYTWLENIWKKIHLFPYGSRKLLACLFSSCSSDCFENIFEKLKFVLPVKLKIRNPGIKLQKFLDVLSAPNIEAAYLNLTSHWKHPEKVVLEQKGGINKLETENSLSFFSDYKRQMMYFDTINYLPNDILTKVDRASMSVGLESRSVYLDHRLVEFAWKLPTEMLINKAGSKSVLRDILKRYVPTAYWDRPKMGFAIPIDIWLRGPLKNWADDLLSKEYLKRKGFFDPEVVSRKWQEHKIGARNWQYELWDILMFNSWLEFNNINS
ncbi:MAG: asparagine synthase (glutamine-hydrolyzing) [Candidatus Omnitrophica bacterium CG11_big_fil_rev_8_21_14_0_20_41_12]|nr:MAG: asparagine synthase (glutamine-hydrolyzing) [Candidatus Omnitrophica bacterium CG11_big_fil_rev_8_21_14_0_20_41_12]